MLAQALPVVFFGSFFGSCRAAPSPTGTVLGLQQRDLVHQVLDEPNQDITQIAATAASIGNDVFRHIISDLQLVTATAAPDGVSAAFTELSGIIASSPKPTNLISTAGQLVAAGLTEASINSTLGFVGGLLIGANSENNFNPISPFPLVFPKAQIQDAPYSLNEAQLRGAIHIPPTFKYGRAGAPQPIILIPGTGNTGYTTFIGNYIPLLTGSDIADPVWLNIPGFLNKDVQLNAEYVSYAISYIYEISNNRQVAIASWSQGTALAQWSTKYWPSTRTKITDVIAFSPDYHGTFLANLIATPDIPLPMAYIQQEYDSNFIRTLRSNGGDSAYVPTTTIYSAVIDEIVESQSGTNASGYLHDAHGVGVTNNELQEVCPGQPAGLFYTHEGTLYNPIGFALLKDALAHDGPGQVSRIDTRSLCGLFLSEGLDLADLLLTENTILTAAMSFLTDLDKTITEPPIKAYASQI